jgi:prepilin-type processing-associated H-X9-DG protein
MNDNYASLVIADFPASYHAKSGALSFADGHAEVHRWRDGRTTPPSASNMQSSPDNPDFIWLEQHTSEHADGSAWP